MIFSLFYFSPPLVYLYSTLIFNLYSILIFNSAQVELKPSFFKFHFSKEKHLSYNTDLSLLCTFFFLQNQFLFFSNGEEHSSLIN